MAHRAGGRTCRARRPELPAGLPGPERLRALLLLGPGPAPAPGTALPGSKLSARFWETRGGRAGPDGGLAAPSLPRRPRAFISSAPARPLRRARLRAASTARRARHPRCPTHQRTPPALRAGAGKPRPETPTWRVPREDPPIPYRLGAAAQCERRDGQGALLPGRRGQNAKERISTPRATAPRVARATFALLPQT